MRHLAILLILCGFAVATLFGATLVEYSMADHSDCVASAISGGPCPLSYAGFLAHHLAAVRTLSTAFMPILIPMLILLAVLALAFRALSYLGRCPLSPPRLRSYRVHAREHTHFRTRTILPWLALFEHSPSFR